MKLGMAMLLTTAIATGVFSAAEDECGRLGVMLVDEAALPPGVNASEVRKCADHPLGEAGPELVKRGGGCGGTGGYSSGCSNGYCWRDCHGVGGNGQNFGAWCWTAKENGYGDWWTCTRDNDCKDNTDYACGKALPWSSCSACGCPSKC